MTALTPVAIMPQLGPGNLSLALPEDMTIDQWREVGHRLFGMERNIQWLIGDWWAFGERAYGERAGYQDGAFGLSYGRLRNLGSIARRFEPSRRRDALTFRHHAEAASLSVADAEEVLDTAAERGWSSRQVREEVGRRTGDLPLGPVVHLDDPLSHAIRCGARVVGAALDVDPSDIAGANKGSPEVVHARQILVYLLHTEAGFTPTRLAAALGRNRTTFDHAIEKVSAMMEDDGLDQALVWLGGVLRDMIEARARISDLVETLAA